MLVSFEHSSLSLFILSNVNVISTSWTYSIVKLYRLKLLSGVLASTCIFNILCLLSNFFDFLLFILNVVNPIYEPVLYADVSNPNSDKAPKYSNPERIMMIFTGLFVVVTTLNMFV